MKINFYQSAGVDCSAGINSIDVIQSLSGRMMNLIMEIALLALWNVIKSV